VGIGGKMPFGEYPYSIDDKGRVVMPPDFRKFVEDGMVLTRGFEGCAYVFPLNEWQRIEAAVDELPLNDKAGRDFMRFFYSGASKLRLDAQSRISIPQTLRAYAALEGDVVVTGAPKRLELWNVDRWNAIIAEVQMQPPTQEALPDVLRRLVG
jgi:MraZ protein